MRVLLHTGKGGVGTTTLVAAAGVHAARCGLRALVVSTDPAHSLADVLGSRLDQAHPVEVEPGLLALQVDARAALAQRRDAVPDHVARTLGALGVPARALADLPGGADVLVLAALRDHVATGAAGAGPLDLLVVDCPSTAGALRLVTLPDVLARLVDRLLAAQRLTARSLTRVGGVELPAADVAAALADLRDHLAEVAGVLRSPTTSVRLVLTPESVVVAESLRTLTALALHGFAVDTVLANRVVPGEGADGWRRSWAAAQQRRLTRLEADVAPVPVRRVPYLAGEPVGTDALAALGRQVYGDGTSALLAGEGPGPVGVERAGTGFDLVLDLPMARAGDLDLARDGDDLVVTVGAHRRVLRLPSALRRCRTADAALRAGRLRVHFEPDPQLWPVR